MKYTLQNKIVVTNTAIIVNDYILGDCPKLENQFKIYDPLRHGYYYLAIYYDEDNERLYLPRGIDLWFVEKLFDDKGIYQAPIPTNHFEDMICMQCTPRDDTQKEALRFMLGLKEYSSNQYKSQLSVNLSTGKGKTFITIAAIAYFNMPGIVITESVNWLTQWKNRTVQYTNIKEKEICMISGSGNVFRLLSYSDKYISRYKLFLVTHDTLQSVGSKNGWEIITQLFNKLKIGVKIYDESHLNFNNICMVDYYTNTEKTYYLTATPAKSNENENRIYQLSFKNVPSIELFDEDVDPHTSYIALRYDSKPSAIQISDCKNAYGLDRNKYTNYVVFQEQFEKLLVILVDLSYKIAPLPNQKILMYIGTNKAINYVKILLENLYPELCGNIGIYTSIVSSEEKQEALSKKFILSTTKSAGAAVDIKGLKMTIVLAEPFKSLVIAKQSLGRTRDDDTYYIEVVDRAFKQCLKFYYHKLPTFQKYAKDCQIIKLSDQELEDRYNSIMQERNIQPAFGYLNNEEYPAAFIYVA